MSSAVSRKLSFTLIELLVVISIIGILTTFTAAAFNNYSRRQRLTEARKNLDSIIRDAQTRAISSVDGLHWGVNLNLDTGTIFLFSTASNFDNASQSLDRSLESGLIISDLTPAANNRVNIIFSVVNGSDTFTDNDGTCLGGSADSACSTDPDRCLAIGLNLQGSTDKRYLKVNERNIFESDALAPCP
ncbi:MAG: prepilin-type N-terminal cleavage/methylation domain-containing protein [Patescibacteria group bacterium]